MEDIAIVVLKAMPVLLLFSSGDGVILMHMGTSSDMILLVIWLPRVDVECCSLEVDNSYRKNAGCNSYVVTSLQLTSDSIELK